MWRIAVLEKGTIYSGRSWQIETVSALEFGTVDQLVLLHDVHEMVPRLQDYDVDVGLEPVMERSALVSGLMDRLNILLVVVVVIILYGMNRRRGRMQVLH